jgi:hypothetical protein
LEVVVAAQEPVPMEVVAVILDCGEVVAEEVLGVLSLFFPERDGCVMAWHKSLCDYLVDKKWKGKRYWVDEQAGHRLLADAAVKVVEGVKEAVAERRKMLLQTTERRLVLADEAKEREAQARRAAELKEEEKVREAEDALKGRQKLLCDPLTKHLEDTYGEEKVEEAKGPAGKNKKGSSSKKKTNEKSSKENASKKKIAHSIDTMQTFSLLEMTAPQTKGEVEGAINQGHQG